MKLLEFCNVTDKLVRSLLQKTWSAEFCFCIGRLHLYSKLVLCKLVQYIGFVYTCTVDWLSVNLYSELVMYTLVVLCTVVQKLICDTCTVN